MSKNTVKLYISKVNEGRVAIKELLSLEDPALGAVFFSGNPAYRDTPYIALKPQVDYYTKELKNNGVTRGVH